MRFGVMATFLELCQDVGRESGTVDVRSFTATANQQGRLLDIVNWVRDAWVKIQNEHDTWLWMRKEFTGSIVAGTARYTGASFNLTDFENWVLDDENTTLYLDSEGVADENKLDYLPWVTWRKIYGRGQQFDNRPVAFTISPQNEFVLGPTPDAACTVNGEYMKTVQTLSADGDIPECPTRFHDIIRHRALMLLAEYDEAATTYAAALSNYKDMMSKLERDQLPTIDFFPEPLA